MKDTILFGDCLQTLKEFDEKARCCITSPPYYGLRDYGGEDCCLLYTSDAADE